MKLKKKILATLVAGVLSSSANADNFGFESGTTTDWTSSTLTTVGTSTVQAGSNTWTINPYGSYMGKLQIQNGSYSSMATALGLTSSSVTAIQNMLNTQAQTSGGNPNPTTAGWVTQQVTLTAGTQFTLAWQYVSVDYVPFNDGSIATLTQSGTNTATVNNYNQQYALLGFTNPGTGDYSTGSYGATGWQVATFDVSVSGTYTLGFGVFNMGDTALSPILFIDEVQGTTLKNGATFGAVAPNNSTAPAAPSSGGSGGGSSTPAPTATVNAGATAGTDTLATAVTVNGGTIQLAATGITLTNTFTVDSNGMTIDQNGKTGTFNGIISGTGAVTIANTGTGGGVTFTATNTYTGATIINSGVTFTNTGNNIASSGTTNAGTFTNSGTTGNVSNSGIFTNSGTAGNITNTGGFTNSTGATVGTVTNSNTVVNSGTTGDVSNTGTFANNPSGTTGAVVNSNIFLNSGTTGVVTNNTNATFTNNSMGTTGAVTNAGTFTNAGTVGSVNNTGTFTLTGTASSITNSGILDVTGTTPTFSSYTQTPTGMTFMTYGQPITVTNDANLAGGLNIANAPTEYGRYTVLTAGTITGDYTLLSSNGANDYLKNTGTGLKLYVTPSYQLTSDSINNVANNVSNMNSLQTGVINNSLGNDCNIFGDNNSCISVNFANTAASTGDLASGGTTIAKRINDHWKAGLFLDAPFNNPTIGSVKQTNNPAYGGFIGWNEFDDGTGLGLQASMVTNTGKLSVTRTGPESGLGTASTNGIAYQLKATYSHPFDNDTMMVDYIGIRQTKLNIGGYTETGPVFPLTVNGTQQTTTDLIAGIGLSHKVTDKLSAIGSVGVVQNLSNSGGTFSGTSEIGNLQTFNTTLPASRYTSAAIGAGLTYEVAKDQRIGASVGWQQKSLINANVTSYGLNYTVGF